MAKRGKKASVLVWRQIPTRNCDPVFVAEDINELLSEGWTLNGQMFQTEAGSVLVFDREKK